MVSGPHLKKVHGITSEEYKKMFPDAKLFSDGYIEKQRLNSIEMWKDPDFVDNRKIAMVGFWDKFYTDPEIRESRRIAVIRSRWGDHVKGNEKSDGKIECLICHKFYKKLAGHHLSSHGVATEEYKLMFPGAPLLSSSAHDSYSASKAGNKNPMIDEKNRDLVGMGLLEYHKDNPNAGIAQGIKTKQYYKDHPEAREAARLKTIEQMKDPAARELLRQYAINQVVPN